MSRRGFTIVELLVSMTAASVVLALVGGLLTALWRAEGTQHRHLAGATTLHRLANQLREDVHQAVDVAPLGAEGNVALGRLRLADGRDVEYRRIGRGIERLEVVSGRTHRSESYALGGVSGARIEVSDEGPLVSLILKGPNDDPTAPARTLRLEALQGAAHRFE
jgi:prepilin-type N-terminal cleavage/methylation domain-containing protein